MIFRSSDDEFMLTAAEPNQAYFEDLIGGLSVAIEDVSEQVASLAFQGPRSKAILSAIAEDVGALRPFGLVETKFGSSPVMASRTGFTGDLGYELWMAADDALDVWDAVFESSEGHGVLPVGETALVMTRLEAGLLLIEADFASSRYAWTEGDRSTPLELGLGWIFRDLEKEERPFIGREAIRRELELGSRRHLVGLVLDWQSWNDVWGDAGHVPPKDHTPLAEETILYDGQGQTVGFATSFMYSPMVQRHIAMAQVIPELAAVGSEVKYEVTIDHGLQYVSAAVVEMPFYDPPHRTA